MEKTVNALKARRNLGQILEEVFYKGDQYIVERAGRPMAVVVPVELYLQWKERKERLFSMVDAVRERSKDISPDEIERDVAAAIAEARAAKTHRST